MGDFDVVNDFEAWATVSARLYELDDTAARQLLSELRIVDVWSNADAGWSRALASDVMDMRLERVARYAVICAQELDNRRRAASGTDFRHEALFGSPRARAPMRSAHQVGGTPFDQATSGDSAERIPAQPIESEIDTPDDPLGETRERELVPGWSLRRYARYVAMLGSGIEDDAVIRSRHGLSEEDHRSLTATFRNQLDAAPSLHRRFRELVNSFRDELTTRTVG